MVKLARALDERGQFLGSDTESAHPAVDLDVGAGGAPLLSTSSLQCG